MPKLSVFGLVLVAMTVTPATVAPAAQAPCEKMGRYGYVEKRKNISCTDAVRVAERVHNEADDCEKATTRRVGRWTVKGPYGDGLSYKYTKGSQRFWTDKPTHCTPA